MHSITNWVHATSFLTITSWIYGNGDKNRPKTSKYLLKRAMKYIQDIFKCYKSLLLKRNCKTTTLITVLNYHT